MNTGQSMRHDYRCNGCNDGTGKAGGWQVAKVNLDKWPEDVAIAFDRARGVASLEYIKNPQNSFASIVADYRAIEAEYLVRVGDNEENAQQVRRIITQMLIQAAWDKDQPFETCQRYSNDLVQLGFYRIETPVPPNWIVRGLLP